MAWGGIIFTGSYFVHPSIAGSHINVEVSSISCHRSGHKILFLEKGDFCNFEAALVAQRPHVVQLLCVFYIIFDRIYSVNKMFLKIT